MSCFIHYQRPKEDKKSICLKWNLLSGLKLDFNGFGHASCPCRQLASLNHRVSSTQLLLFYHIEPFYFIFNIQLQSSCSTHAGQFCLLWRPIADLMIKAKLFCLKNDNSLCSLTHARILAISAGEQFDSSFLAIFLWILVRH